MQSFFQRLDPESCTYTYILVDEHSRKAVLIDSVREQIERDLTLLDEHGLSLEWILETHVHADHVTGAAQLQTKTSARSAVGEQAGVVCADRHLRDGDRIGFGTQYLTVLATPGHTAGCVSYLWNDRVFSGDALLIDACGRTDFQGGDPARLYESITQKLFKLPDETLVYPAHDYSGRQVSSIGEQRLSNPRLAGKSRQEFVTLMDNLDLDAPRKIQIALPANRLCGRDPEVREVT